MRTALAILCLGLAGCVSIRPPAGASDALFRNAEYRAGFEQGIWEGMRLPWKR